MISQGKYESAQRFVNLPSLRRRTLDVDAPGLGEVYKAMMLAEVDLLSLQQGRIVSQSETG